jgi:NADH-quinone oxidoreductase subunit M
MNLLLLVLLLPAAGFLVALGAPRSSPASSRYWALGISLITFLASLALLGWFDRSLGGDQFTVDLLWIASPEIRFHIAADGVSLWLVLLSTFLTPICVLLSWNSIQNRAKEFYAFLLLLEFGLVGVFLAQDLFLFYVFWEVSLVPMYFLIGIWGHDRRIYAAVKFFLYTMAGSVLMLAAIIYLYNRAGTFGYAAILDQLASGRLGLHSLSKQMLLFLGLLRRLRHQSAAVPAAHLAAGRARGSSHRRFGDAGLRHAEDGHLTVSLHFCLPLFPAAARRCARGSRCWPSSASFTARWSPWCSRI